MADFILTDRLTHVNAAYVAYTTRRKVKEGHWTTVLWTVDGRELGSTSQFEPENYTSVVAAKPDQEAIVIYSDKEGVFFQRQQIIAWRIEGSYPTPVFVEDLCSNATVIIPTPDGKWLSQGDRQFDTIEDALQYVKECEAPDSPPTEPAERESEG